jgi:NAD(P)-dependent dehydrogenase (short-subunit alcohol dehydrogenase family)
MIRLSTNMFPALLTLIAVAGLQPAHANGLDADNPTVLITGSNRGIGLAFAKYYAEQGWNVLATCRKPESADDLKALQGLHPNIHIEQLDVTDHARIDALAESTASNPLICWSTTRRFSARCRNRKSAVWILTCFRKSWP